MRIRVVGPMIMAAAALAASMLFGAVPAQAAEPREAPAPVAIDVPTVPFVDLPAPYAAATVDFGTSADLGRSAAVSAQLWRFRYDCGVGVSKRACAEVRSRYGYAGWATSAIYWRPPGCTAPRVKCPSYYFYYGH